MRVGSRSFAGAMKYFQFILIGHKILFLGGCIFYLCDSTVKEIGCIDKPRSSNGGICCPKNGGIINTKHI